MRGKIIVTSAYPELTDMVREVAEQLSMEVVVVEAVLEDAVEQVNGLMKKYRVDVIGYFCYPSTKMPDFWNKRKRFYRCRLNIIRTEMRQS